MPLDVHHRPDPTKTDYAELSYSFTSPDTSQTLSEVVQLGAPGSISSDRNHQDSWYAVYAGHVDGANLKADEAKPYKYDTSTSTNPLSTAKFILKQLPGSSGIHDTVLSSFK